MHQTLLEKLPFGTLPDGRETYLYVLKNRHGAQAKITTYGATLTEFIIPNKSGQLANVVLGYDNLADYIACKAYFGATVGRIANRIDSGKFILEGKSYEVVKNDDRKNSLHGGFKGFHRQLWTAATSETEHSTGVTFRHVSEHMEEGFPGAVEVEVSYTLTEENTLIIGYLARARDTTIINLTNHSYFNLNGAGSGDILNHELRIDADHYTPVNERLIPSGEFAEVEGTALDFRRPKKIGAQIKEMPADLGGYDHNFVLRQGKGGAQIEVSSAESGRRMRVTTTQPGMQLYCGNFLDGTDVGHGGPYHRYYGFCLETQHFPDAINQKNFPSVILKKGETYTHQTVFDFTP